MGGFVLSLSGTALAECAGHGQQTAKADVPVTVASGAATDGRQTDKK